MILRSHTHTLRGERVLLRPMTEADWPLLLRWNNDPEVLYFSEGDEVYARTLEEIQGIYRRVSQQAFCFIAQLGERPIGECWLQQMNLPRILQQHPGSNCWRIDLVVGEKELWGEGLGTEMISLLTRFGFEQQSAELIFGCDIADYNPRSLRAFEKAGYRLVEWVAQPPGSKARYCCDMAVTREDFASFVERPG